jgi:polyphosphate kinase
MRDRIEREINHAGKGKKARLIAKMNALVEPEMIQTLYRASQAGVQVDLIVRGMCSLRPGVPGLSENIRVHSIIGRFLEHHRAFWFANGGEAELLLSSADWMERNLFRRVEIAFPVLDRKLRERVHEQLEAYIADKAQSWMMTADGGFERLPCEPGEKGVQTRLLDEATAS